MATGAWLPPVITRLTADVTPFIASMAKAKAAIEALPTTKDIDLNANMGPALGQLEKYKDLTDKTTAAQAALEAQLGNTTRAIIDQGAAIDVTNKSISSMSRRITNLVGNEVALAAAMDLANNSMKDRQGALGALGMGALGGAATGGGGSRGGGAGFLNWWGLGGHVPLWGGAFGSTYMVGRIAAWHLALDGVLESSIAVVSATIAMTAGLAAMAPAADDIYNRLTAIHQVSVSLGQTIPPLSGWFEQLQHAEAGPTIGAYGGLVNLMGNPQQYTSTIQQIVDGIDSVVAKLDIYQKSQNGFNGVLQHGLGYAGQFEGILGNLGKTFTNLMAAEPGTVHFMLDFVQGVSNAVAWLTHFNGLTKTLLGTHAVITWGGALYSWASKLLGKLPLVGTAIKTAMGNPYVAIATAGVALLAYNWDRSTRAIGGYIAAQDQLVAGMKPEQAANAMPGLIKGNLSQMQGLSVSKILPDFNSWSNTGGTIADWMKQLGHDLGPHAGWSGFGNFFKDMVTPDSGAHEAYLQDMSNLQAHAQKLSGEWTNLFAAGAPLVKQGYSMQQAFSLEALAGVNAGDSFQVMTQKIQNLIRGYGDLGNNAGMLTNSINATDFAVEQQQSSISKVTQGWSTWIGMITGGASAFTTYAQQIIGLNQLNGNAATQITVANGKVSDSTKLAASGVAASLNGISTNTLQMNAAFSSGVTDASNMLNQLMTLDSAASLGATGTKMLTQAGKDLVAQLLPTAKGSQLLTTQLYALAQQGGYQGANSFKALTQWVGNAKNPTQDLLNILTTFTAKAGNLATDVKNLAGAIDPQMTSAMSGAIIAASGGTGVLEKFASAVLKSNGNTGQLAGSAKALWQQMTEVYGHTSQAKDQFEAFAVKLGIAQGSADKLWNDLQASGGRTSAAVIKDIQSIQNQLNSLHGKTIDVNINENLYHNGVAGTTGGSYIATHKGATSFNGYGYASGTSGARSGWAWVGEKGPELVNFRGGETVIPNHVAQGYAGGTIGDGVIEVHSHVHLDGKEIFKTVQRESVGAQRRTGTNGLSKRTR
jgi:hypothetical protein